jgi:hypothetical protein
MDSSGPLTSSDQFTINGPQLTITNASAVENEDIRCSEVLANGITVTGRAYTVEPLVKPGPPVVTKPTVTHSTITLTWSTMLYCFESEILTFVVIWNESGNVTTDSANTTVSPYTINGLQPNTSYEISIKGVTRSGVVSEARILSTTTGLQPVEEVPLSPFPVAAVVAPVVIVVVILIVVVMAIIVVAVCVVAGSKEKHGSYYIDGSEQSSTYRYESREMEHKHVSDDEPGERYQPSGSSV